MNKHQFINLANLARLKPEGKARNGAFLCLVLGKTQVEAATMLECQQSTISAAIQRIKRAQRLAIHAIT